MAKKILKIVFPLLIFAFLFRSVLVDWESTKLYIQNIQGLPLVAAFIFMLLIYPQGAYAWFKVAKEVDPSIQLNKAISVWIISNTSRYIPGTVWQYIGRIELATRNLGMSRGRAGISLVYEIFLNLAAAGLLSLFVILYVPSIPKFLFVILFPLAFLFFHPRVIATLLDLLLKLLKKKFKNIVISHDFSGIYKSLIWFIINFFLNGLAIYFLFLSLGGNAGLDYIIPFTAFYAFSWLVGYITLIAPGGLGVMEGSLVILLSTLMPMSLASIVAILYRFFLTLAELGVFVTVLVFDYGRSKKILGRKS